MKHSARFWTTGGFGSPSPPAFAFGLGTKGLANKAKLFGVRRYGRIKDDGEDTRPVAPLYQHQASAFWGRVANWQLATGDAATRAALKGSYSPFGASGGINYTDARLNRPNAFYLPNVLAPNEAFAFRAFIEEIGDVSFSTAQETKGSIWHVRAGGAGYGILFQVRDGRPEVALLSPQWNRTDELNLRTLWALSAPTAAETRQIDTLITKIYGDSLTLLSLDGSSGRDSWTGESFFVTLVPEPRGVLHIILEGGGGQDAIAFSARVNNPTFAPLWQGSLEVGGTGGAWILQPLQVRFPTGTANSDFTLDTRPHLDYGPWYLRYSNGAIIDPAIFANTQFSAQSDAHKDVNGNPLASVSFAELQYVDGQYFGFRATFTSSDDRYPAWLYGVQARLPNGDRTGLTETEISFDTDDLYNPVSPESLREEGNPILNVRITVQRNGKRMAELQVRDQNGVVTEPGGVENLRNRVVNLSIGGEPCFTNGIVLRPKITSMKRFAAVVGDEPTNQHPLYVNKGETRFTLTIADGWQHLEEQYCDPPIILDGLILGAALRLLFKAAGYSDAEIANVPANLGPQLRRPQNTEEIGYFCDENTTIAAAIDGLMERKGLGLRVRQGRDGVWVLEPKPTAPSRAFTSTASQNDPDLIRGGTREMILDPLDFEMDDQDYFTHQKVIGGTEESPIVVPWEDNHALTLGPGGFAHKRYTGRIKRREPFKDTSALKNEGDCNYALRSQVDMYGHPGRNPQFVTWFDFKMAAWDVATCDGVPCRILGYEGDMADDQTRMQKQEIV